MYRLLQVAVFFLFLGRAWQHWLYRNPPYEALFEALGMAPVCAFHRVLAVFFLLAAIAVFFLHKAEPVARVFIWLGTVGVLTFGVADQLQKLPYYNQFVEHTIQYTLPLFLLYFPRQGVTPTWLIWAKVAIVCTFTGHGLYALNWVPTPAHFIAMTHHVTGLDEAGSRTFLWIAGFLDLVLSVLIFTKGKVRSLALAYAVLWGLATAVARIWGHVHLGWYEAFMYWVPEFIYRLGHAILPLSLWLFYRYAANKQAV